MFEPDEAGGPGGAGEPEGVGKPRGAGEPGDVRDSRSALLEDIYRRAPVGALTIATVATAIVLALWLAFYVMIFLPRSGS